MFKTKLPRDYIVHEINVCVYSTKGYECSISCQGAYNLNTPLPVYDYNITSAFCTESVFHFKDSLPIKLN